jgi:hypothetical protein
MKVVVIRSGGWPPPRRGEVEGAALSSEQAQALQNLLAQPESEAGPGADMFTYKIEVHDESGVRGITVPGDRMPESLRDIGARR